MKAKEISFKIISIPAFFSCEELYKYIKFIAKRFLRNFQFRKAVMFPLFINERIG